MDSRKKQDKISTLPDGILLLILSFLSFKDNLKTSVLSRRWRYLCYETRNLSFKESEYVDHNVPDEDDHLTRVSFVRYMRQWISRALSQVIEIFEICLSDPLGFKEEIEYLIEFALSKQVKHLLLDFADPFWTNAWDAVRVDVVVELPALIYSLATLESLQIFACEFDPSRFKTLGVLRKLYIGWVNLKEINSLLSKCPSLESLRLHYCLGTLDSMMLAGKIKELVLENCYFPSISCSINLPNIDVFEYSGDVLCFHFEKLNTTMKEVSLEFGVEPDNDPYTNKEAGEILSHLLNDLRSARSLTVCPYLLKVIQECDNPVDMLRDLETRHLVLNTDLDPKEFVGIKLLLDYCPNLETLTFDLTPCSFPTASYGGINRETSWLQNVSPRCFRSTLKVVEVRHFCGSGNELSVLNYLVRPEHGHVLQRLDLYLPNCLQGIKRLLAHASVAMLQRISNRVQVRLLNA